MVFLGGSVARLLRFFLVASAWSSASFSIALLVKDQAVHDSEVLASAGAEAKRCPGAVVDAVAGGRHVELEELLEQDATLRDCRVTFVATSMVVKGNEVEPKVDGTVLHWSTDVGNSKVIEVLLKHGFNPNARLASTGTYNVWAPKSTPLMFAACHGDIKALKALLQAPYIDVNLQSQDGHTALIHAVISGNDEVVAELLKESALDPNIQDVYGKTALFWAAEKGLSAVTTTLLTAKDINPNLGDEEKMTPLMMAARQTAPEVVKALLSSPEVVTDLQNKDGMTALMFAAVQNNHKVIERILRVSNSSLDMQNKENLNALMLASEGDCLRATYSLVRFKAKVNVQQQDGNTALILAAMKGNWKVIRWLLRHNSIDVNIQNKDNRTALMFAAQRNFLKVVNVLKHIAGDKLDFALRDEDGVNALVLAAGNSHDSVIRLLQKGKTFDELTFKEELLEGFLLAAECGHEQAFNNFLQFDCISIDSQNKDGDNALMRAVIGNELNMAKTLLKRKPQLIQERNQAGWTLLHFAVQAHHYPDQMVEFVLDSCPEGSALLDEVNEERRTPLQMAVRTGHIKLVETLLHRGAAVRHKQQDVSSALRLALGDGDYIITKMLLKRGARVELDIHPDDIEGKRLAVWMGVELSEMQLVVYFTGYEPSWVDVWEHPAKCSGRMKDICHGDLLSRAKTQMIVNLMLDWQERVDEIDPTLTVEEKYDRYDPGLTAKSKKVRAKALEATLELGRTEAALALLSRGAGKELDKGLISKFRKREMQEDPTQMSRIGVPLDKIEIWNRFHWCSFSCDTLALALGLKFPTDVLVALLDDTQGGQTPFDVSECPPGPHPRFNALAKQSKVLQETWKVKILNDSLVGIFTIIVCTGTLALRLFIMRIQSLQQYRWCFMVVSPLWFCLAGCWLVATVDSIRGESRSMAVQCGIGWVTAIVAVACSIAASAIYARPHLQEQLVRIKHRGNNKLDRCWEKSACASSWLLVVGLFLEEITNRGKAFGLMAGLVHAIASTLPLCMAAPKLTEVVLRLTPGFAVVAAVVSTQVFGLSLPGPLTPQTVLLIALSFALAWADIPGIFHSVGRSSIRVEEEIELSNARVRTEFCDDSKFTANRMIFGRAELAALGIERALGLSNEYVAEGLKNPIETMRREIEAFGDQNDRENFAYIVDGVSGRTEDFPSAVSAALRNGVYHGGHLGPDDFDTGHEGRSLADWMQVKEVVLAKLTQAEFVAVRFYTSSSFAKINGPLRRKAQAFLHDPAGEAEPHPWAMVVYLMDRGIKKLRSVQAQVDPEAFARRRVLWRGMKNMAVDMSKFYKHGGTEMAPMSTTTNEAVARHYAASKVPLVFKYIVGGMKTGVSIRFLSLFPKEEEFLYAPLTYLTWTNEYEDDGATILVVEPVMS